MYCHWCLNTYVSTENQSTKGARAAFVGCRHLGAKLLVNKIIQIFPKKQISSKSRNIERRKPSKKVETKQRLEMFESRLLCLNLL